MRRGVLAARSFLHSDCIVTKRMVFNYFKVTMSFMVGWLVVLSEPCKISEKSYPIHYLRPQ